jgi:Spy/CpxP family protein refolding chaperone
MNRRQISRWIGILAGSAVLAATVIMLAPSLAQGQQQPAPDSTQVGPPRPGRGFGPGRGPGGPGGFGMGLRGADLTDAQREQVRAIQQRHAQEMQPLMERARAAHKALSDAIHASPVDVNQLRVAANEVGAAESELAFVRAQIESEMLTVLTAEQRQQLETRRQEMEARRGEMQQRGRRGGPPPAQ